MLSLSYGVEIETLVRPKLMDNRVKKLIDAKNWNYGAVIGKERHENNILRDIIVDRKEAVGVPAHIMRKDYTK